MHLKYMNVNDAFHGLVSGIDNGSIPTRKTDSRNGPVLQIPEPVIIEFMHPRERVLFNSERDCNHFFHLFEPLWMLAGCNDIAPLAYYTPKLVDYSDDGETLNGAYGERWRYARNWYQVQLDGEYECVAVDQLKTLIEHLRAKPES